MYRKEEPLQASQLYATDLTDEQWAILEPLLPRQSGPGRPQHISLRMIINAMFYLLRTGIQWRMMPRNYPKWQTVYYHFGKWRANDTWLTINDTLRELNRVRSGRKPTPSMIIADSQTAKTTEAGGERGIDGGKHICGRKRHAVVDTMGNLLRVKVTRGNVHDTVGAEEVLEQLEGKLPRLEKLLADGSFAGEPFKNWVERHLHCVLEVVERDKDQKGFVVQVFRWIVERTFAWMSRNRRLAKDYEYLAKTTETLMYMGMSALILKRLT